MSCRLQQGSQRMCPIKLLGHWAPFWTQSFLASNGRKQYLISFLLQHKVIPQPLGDSGTSQKTNKARSARKNRLFSSSQQTAQISMPVSENMTPSEIRRVVDVNQIKRIHFGHMAIFSSTRLLIALVEFRPFTTMSEVENEQFGLYGSLGKIENTKDEWWNQGANLSSVGCILGQSLQYVADNFFEKIQNCYKSWGVPSFDQVNYEADIPANQGAFKFASALTFTMIGFKNAAHVEKDALLYASGWWFQADKRTGQIQRDASKKCTGGKSIFPKEHFWIDLPEFHALIQVFWASSTFVNYTYPAQDNESTTLVGMSVPCSRRLAKAICQKRHGYYEVDKGVGYQIRDGNTILSQFKE
ncbi:hypothetical protein O181_119762 [Austropuccinia psidii MF-1]|uniref:Tet-like 2OG-Fe(II) oxygenase domain-containing protein n=1 Tax=Austropuccinia psidii MF-1 TaxID=1389203 RepID=A0A9Q3KFR3_9BASI|nr:hypothetical protein [Austropuccinia psidii MF-1]